MILESHGANSSGVAQQVLRVAFLIGSDDRSTLDSVEAICALPGIKPVAVLMDTELVPISRRLRNLRRNISKEGWSYPLRRSLSALRNFTERLAYRTAVSEDDVHKLLHRAFPQRFFSISELGNHYGFVVHAVGNLNGPVAVERLSASEADLGIVLGTRILKATTFSVPRLGSINLHKGKVPDYRGTPPGFWELFDGAPTAGVTVHFVDSGLDTGDVLVEREITISSKETPDSLLEKLHREGNVAICEAISKLQDGSAVRKPQMPAANKPRTKPSHKDVLALRNRLPHWRNSSDTYGIFKNLYALAVYYLGVYAIVRAIHRLSSSRGVIFLYHRINDYARDPLTADTQSFAAHLLALSKRYSVMDSSDLVRRIRENVSVPPTAVTIHFDDCYKDIFINGAPLLRAIDFSATAFINSGFVDTCRVYPHDAQKYPFVLANLSSMEVREWVNLGFEVGNHTVNHVDLGVCPLEEVKHEIRDCERDLQRITGRPVNLFSFPFGGNKNIRPEVVDCIRSSGYLGLFSAHGGFVTSKTDPYDIPRLAANGDLNPLVLLLEVEDLAPHQLADHFRHFARGVPKLFKSI
jgi:peptidoglycan/xylan/chitin deacetylase (PgdA/CDA1 family)